MSRPVATTALPGVRFGNWLVLREGPRKADIRRVYCRCCRCGAEWLKRVSDFRTAGKWCGLCPLEVRASARARVKVVLHLAPEVAEWIAAQAQRLDRTQSWVVVYCVRHGLEHLRALPSPQRQELKQQAEATQ